MVLEDMRSHRELSSPVLEAHDCCDRRPVILGSEASSLLF